MWKAGSACTPAVNHPDGLRLGLYDSMSKALCEGPAMRIPVIRGTIDRRILVNYRVDPEILAKLLPKPFQLKLTHGAGMAGICLIRLQHVRPRLLPAFLGFSSENA